MYFSSFGFIAVLLAADTLAAPHSSTKEPRKDKTKGNFVKLDTIEKDVLIVGAGASGTYAAHKLLDANKTVIVVEKELITGGNTNTYYDPATRTPVDYGVVVWHNNDLVRQFFSRFNITLFNTLTATAAPIAVNHVDFRTGKVVADYVPQDPTAALQAYYALLLQYPYLEKGFELPDPVPEDLLLPFGQFMQKYNLTDMSQLIYSFAQGLGNVLAQPTIYVFKNFGSEIIIDLQLGFLTTGDNSAIYRSSAAELTASSSLLLNSTITRLSRNQKGKSTHPIRAIVSTPTGPKLILAKQILISTPPKAELLGKWMDLNAHEYNLFSQFNNSAYYTGLIRNAGLPANLAFANARSDTEYFLPELPGLYSLRPTIVPGLIDVKFGSPSTLSIDEVKASVTASVSALAAVGGAVPGANADGTIEWAAFNAHVPFELTVNVEAIRKGFYRDLYALQGLRNTWYTGASWHAQDSSMLWEFTEGIVGRIIGAM